MNGKFNKFENYMYTDNKLLTKHKKQIISKSFEKYDLYKSSNT